MSKINHQRLHVVYHMYYFLSIKSHHQCITKDQVCNGEKDCISGMDESNCIYYGGQCDGFLCTIVEECVEFKKVCDKKKDCFDGTDETMCTEKLAHEFECNETNGYGMDKVR